MSGCNIAGGEAAVRVIPGVTMGIGLRRRSRLVATAALVVSIVLAVAPHL